MKRFFTKLVLPLIILVAISANIQAQVYTFTNCNATGIDGPSQTQVNTAYAFTTLAGLVTSSSGIQVWNIPIGGTYKVEVYGAEGYGPFAGRGAYMSGEFTFASNQQVKVLVGQQGGCCVGSGTNQYGGGGGSFVATSTNTPIIVAGGGGGARYNTAILPSSHGNTTTNGNNGTGTAGGAGGTGGNGGAEAGIGGGGGGFTGNGGGTPHGGKSFINGGQGGTATSSGGWGGFGGGGGANSWDNGRGGGGGGYSGGGGAGSSTTAQQVGGGGGSYNSGTNQVNNGGVRQGHGLVVFTLMTPPVPNNAGVSTLPSLVAGFCAGNQTVTARINNYGNNLIDSVYVHWTINGNPQPSQWFKFTPPIDTIGTVNNFRVVTLGNYNFSPGSHIVKAWTTLPNNIPDAVPSNDTFTFNGATKLGGTYTINSALPTAGTNYNNFTTLANDLNTIGVCAPVIVNVVNGSGPYTERFLLNNIPGSSTINTVRINGNGNTLRFNSSAIANAPIVAFNGTRYVTIDSLHIQTQNTSIGWGVHIYNGAQFDTITRCHIDLTSMTTATTSAAAIAISGTSSVTSATTANDIYIANNRIVGGANNNPNGAYYLITVYGSPSYSTGVLNTGPTNIKIYNNDISNFYYMGIYAYGVNHLEFVGNDLHRKDRTAVGTITTYAMYLYYMQGGKIMGNRIHDLSAVGYTYNTSVYGIYAYNYYNGPNTPITIANNAIYNMHTYLSTHYGMLLDNNANTHVYHNTINYNSIISGAGTMYGLMCYTSTQTANNFTIKNNNITFTGGTTGTKYGIYISSSANNVDMQKDNVYFNTTQAGTQYWGYYGANYATLAAFQTAYPLKEVGSLENDPLYVDEVNGNMQPQELLFYENGDDVFTYVQDDIYGYDRTTTPTPGAFEIGPCDVFNTGVRDLVTPIGSFCSGERSFQVRIVNEGLNDIDSVWVHWTFNGVPQPPVHYVATVSNRNAAPFNTAIVLLGNVFVPWGMTSTFAAWTALPNSELDKCNSNDTLSLPITPTTTILTNLGPDTLICDGYELILSAGPQSQYIYLWDDNSAQNQRSVYTAGTYYVLKSDLQNNCSGHDTIVVTTNPSPTVYLGPDSAVCMGQHVTLDAGIGNITNDKLWDNNDTGQFRDVHIAGTYSVTVTNEFGCQDDDEFVLSYRDVPANDGINAIYMLDLTYNFNLINPQYVADVIWDFGDGSPVDTGFFVTHKYKKHGLYNVSILMISSCDGGDPVQETITLDAIGLAVNEIENSDLKLYPNPSTEKLNIEVANAQIEEVSVYNVLGQLINTEKVRLQSKYELNVSGMSSGMYTIKVITDKGQLIRKFEVVR